MASSLYNSDLSIPYNIRIYDDCSTEYGIDELKSLFPNAVSIIRNNTNFKADLNMFSFFKDFLLSSDKYLFAADSDLIFNKNWLLQGIELLHNTDGVLSLFNATSHQLENIVDSNLCTKNAVGCAGTLFSRERIEEIVNYFSFLPETEISSFDWKWSNFLVNKNIRIFCIINSLIQHIGFHGQNTIIEYKGFKKIKTHKPYFDYGRNFKVDTLETGQIINNIFEQFIDQNKDEDDRIFYLLSQRPISRVKIMIKKLLRVNVNKNQ
jgi:hypothetical protein